MLMKNSKVLCDYNVVCERINQAVLASWCAPYFIQLYLSAKFLCACLYPRLLETCKMMP